MFFTLRLFSVHLKVIEFLVNRPKPQKKLIGKNIRMILKNQIKSQKKNSVSFHSLFAVFFNYRLYDVVQSEDYKKVENKFISFVLCRFTVVCRDFFFGVIGKICPFHTLDIENTALACLQNIYLLARSRKQRNCVTATKLN